MINKFNLIFFFNLFEILTRLEERYKIYRINIVAITIYNIYLAIVPNIEPFLTGAVDPEGMD